MKILHIIASANLSEGGPIENALKLGEVFAERGHRQDFATLDPPDFPPHSDIPARIFALGQKRELGRGPLSRARRWINYSPHAVPWLRANAPDYDVVIISGLWNYAAMASKRALVGGPTPYVVFTHGMLDPWFKRTYRLKSALKQLIWPFSEGALLRNAAFVMFTCEEERVLAQNTYRPYRAREKVIAFGTADVVGDAATQVAEFRAGVPALGDRPYLLFLSRIHRKKGADLLIEAFGRIAPSHPEIDLVMAGPDQEGLREGLEARARSLGCSGRVHWPGMLKGDVKWGALRGCEAFALTSHQENFGIAIAEAMACARPVLISNKVNIWREVGGDGAGLVDIDTIEGAERLLARFLAMDASQRATMGAKGRASFLSRFHIDSAATDLENLLAEVSANAVAALG
jgi:glycosyltransferase involved in cell wall biosynthesis